MQLLSSIGEPIDRPELAGIEIDARGGLTAGMRARALGIADAWLADIRKVTVAILNDEIQMY